MASNKTFATRLGTKHSVFGFPQLLPHSQLPTRVEVFRCYLWYRNKSQEQGESITSTRGILKLVTDDIIGIWNKASIPVIAYRSILASLEKLIDKGKELQKYPQE